MAIFLCTLCAFLESTIAEVSDKVKEAKGLSARLQDMGSGGILSRFKKYLNQEAKAGKEGVGLPPQVFIPVQFLFAVRHTFLHSFGDLTFTFKKNRNIIMDHVNSWDGIQIQDNRVIISDSLFCEEAIKEVQKFLNHVKSVVEPLI